MKSKATSKIEKTNQIKSRGLFDHIKHIREEKNPNYYDSLSEEEKKSFNKYMIIRILSMDSSLIEEMSLLSKYFEILPENIFYKLLVKIVPKGRKFCPYIKNKSNKINQDIIKCINNKFKIGTKDSLDYYNVLMNSESGMNELIAIIQSYGYNDSEIEKMFE